MPMSLVVSMFTPETRVSWLPPPGAPAREIRDTSLNWNSANKMPMIDDTMMNASVAAGDAMESAMATRGVTLKDAWS